MACERHRGLKERARALRRAGLSYAEIAARTGASKGTLSLWLHDIELTEEQCARMVRLGDEGRQRAGETLHVRAQERRRRILAEAGEEVRSLSRSELFVAGVVAYWAEGSKAKPWRNDVSVRFVNSDPSMIELFLAWLDLVGVRREDLVYRLAIHETADEQAALAFWSRLIGVPVEVFRRTTFKRHKPKTNRRNTGDGYRGCLTISVSKSSGLYHRIEGWYRGIISSMGRGVRGSTGDFGSPSSGSSPDGPAHPQGRLFERPIPYLARIPA